MSCNGRPTIIDTLQAVANTGKSACITLSSDCKVENVRLGTVENATLWRNGQEVKTETMSASDPVKQASDRINALEAQIGRAFEDCMSVGMAIERGSQIDRAFNQPRNEMEFQRRLSELLNQINREVKEVQQKYSMETKADTPWLDSELHSR